MKKILFVGAVIVIAIVCSINLYISNKNGDKLGSSIYLKNIEMLASAECNCGTGCRWKILEGSGYCVANGDGNSCSCGSTTHP